MNLNSPVESIDKYLKMVLSDTQIVYVELNFSASKDPCVPVTDIVLTKHFVDGTVDKDYQTVDEHHRRDFFKYIDRIMDHPETMVSLFIRPRQVACIDGCPLDPLKYEISSSPTFSNCDFSAGEGFSNIWQRMHSGVWTIMACRRERKSIDIGTSNEPTVIISDDVPGEEVIDKTISTKFNRINEVMKEASRKTNEYDKSIQEAMKEVSQKNNDFNQINSLNNRVPKGNSLAKDSYLKHLMDTAAQHCEEEITAGTAPDDNDLPMTVAEEEALRRESENQDKTMADMKKQLEAASKSSSNCIDIDSVNEDIDMEKDVQYE